MSIVPTKYLNDYKESQPITLLKHFNKLKTIGRENFDFYMSGAAVYSSMIEGNRIDFDSYLRYSHSGMNNNGKSFKEIEELKQAYNYAKGHVLNLANFMSAHKMATKTVVTDAKYRGKIRDKEVYIFSSGVKIYTGASVEIVSDEINKLFADIQKLIARDLTINEVFYYASLLHLKFVHIHPFADGNGRMARLLEKWFLSQKLGQNAWFIQSEKLYQKRIKSYYENVNLGTDYKILNYDYCMKFLLMLPMALRLRK